MAVKSDKGKEPYGLDPAFERAVVALSCSNQRFYGRIGSTLEYDLMGDERARLAMQACMAIFKDNGKGPDSSLVVVQRLRRWMQEGKVSHEQILAVVDYFEEAEEAGIPSEDSVVGELAPILRRRFEGEAVRSAIETYGKRGDLKQIAEMISKAAQLGVNDTTTGTRLGLDSFEEISALRHLDRLPTGIPELDIALDGGPPRGTMSFVLGGPGDGKSTFLNSVSAACIWGGGVALYATLELPRATVLARHLANLTKIPINSILDGAMDVARSRLQKIAPHLGALIVKEFTAGATTIEDMKAWVNQVEADEKRPVDLLVIDYGDMLTTSSKKDRPGHEIMKDVYRGMRVYAAEQKFWIWTASQPKASNDKKRKKLDTYDAAGSQDKSRETDLMITLNADDDGMNVNYWIAKYRHGKGRQAVGPLPTDFHCGQIAAMTNRGDLPSHATAVGAPF